MNGKNENGKGKIKLIIKPRFDNNSQNAELGMESDSYIEPTKRTFQTKPDEQLPVKKIRLTINCSKVHNIENSNQTQPPIIAENNNSSNAELSMEVESNSKQYFLNEMKKPSNFSYSSFFPKTRPVLENSFQSCNAQRIVQNTLTPIKKVTNPLKVIDIFKKLEIYEWTNNKAMNPGAKVFRFGRNGYVLVLNDLGEDFCKLLKEILTERMSDNFYVGQENIVVKKAYFINKVNLLNNYFENHGTPNIYFGDIKLYKEEYFDLFIKVIGIRLTKEIVDHKISFDKTEQTLEQCKMDFAAMCGANGYRLYDTTGMYTSNYFMQKHRFKVGKVEHNSINDSPSKTITNFSLQTCLSAELKKSFFNHGQLKKNDKTFTKETLQKKIIGYQGAFQFRPTYVKNILYTLKNNYGIDVHKVCDWCSGWGDRLVGTLASANDYNVCQYIGTDPNTNLHNDYVNICSTFVPANYQVSTTESNYTYIKVNYKHTVLDKNFEVCIYKKPAEDLNDNELRVGESDLMLTSIPYFNKELYEGEEQSHKRYPKYSLWKDGFLTPFVNQSVKSVRHLGCIAINTANINKNEKTESNRQGVDIGEHKIYDDLKEIMMNYNQNNTKLDLLCEIPFAIQKTPSNTMIFQVKRSDHDSYFSTESAPDIVLDEHLSNSIWPK